MLPLDTGAKNTSVPSARVARNVDSAFDTSMVTSAAAASRTGLAPGSNGVTAGTLIDAPAVIAVP